MPPSLESVAALVRNCDGACLRAAAVALYVGRVAALGLALASQGAFAHAPAKAQHGGIVQLASDLSFELVLQASGALIYVVDHDDAADVSKMGGKLTVLNGSDKAEVDLKPSGSDNLVATGAKVGAGSKVVASITGASSKTVTVRFTVK